MIEQHYTDEALLSLLDARGSDTLLGDPHLAACATCADALESYKDIAGLLCDKEVWDEEDAVFESAPVPETLSRIRAFADATAREDAEAVQMVNELLEMPSEWWAEEVRHDERYHTAGVVRRLVAVAHEAATSSPVDGEKLTTLATDLLELIDSTIYGEEAIHLLRGRAWREHGDIMDTLGRIDAASSALSKAMQAFGQCSMAEVDIARTQVVMAVIEWRTERYDAALASARRARRVFETYEVDRVRNARWIETNVLVSSGRYREALEAYRLIENELASRPADLAGIIVNMAYCYRELGEFDRAMPQYQFALGIYEDLGKRSEATRVRWNIAGVLAATGKLSDAESGYRKARREFESFGMVRDAALVDLSLAEISLAQQRFAEAESLCRSVIAYFETVTTPTSSKALAALSYLREAVEQRKASAAVAEAVRRYVSRLPQQPNLLFAPPPLP